jgi:hypothetical protein
MTHQNSLILRKLHSIKEYYAGFLRLCAHVYIVRISKKNMIIALLTQLHISHGPTYIYLICKIQ